MARVVAGLVVVVILAFAGGFAIARALRDTPQSARAEPVTYSPAPTAVNLDRAAGFPKLTPRGAPGP